VRVVRSATDSLVEVQMRPASLEASEVLRDAVGAWIDAPMTFDGRALRFTAVSMGNPHAVLFEDVGADAASLGPRIEKDQRFKAGANVGFARLGEGGQLDLRVWERGVGFTLACGTGACAAAVAAVETGRAARHQTLQVHLPGGPLAIRVEAPGEPISMTGPARKVFEGQLDLA
jgi:diaminopimelate epimerase